MGGDTTQLKPSNLIVAIEDKKIIGCVRLKRLDDKNFELASLAVLEKYRNKHIGSELVKRILIEKKGEVFLMCFRKNLAFYIKNGFELIEVNELPKSLKEEYFRVKNVFLDKNEIIIMKLKMNEFS